MPPPSGKSPAAQPRPRAGSVCPAMTIGRGHSSRRSSASGARRPIQAGRWRCRRPPAALRRRRRHRRCGARFRRARGGRRAVRSSSAAWLAQLLFRLAQLLQQVAVVDGRGSVLGQRAKQGQLLLVERVRSRWRRRPARQAASGWRTSAPRPSSACSRRRRCGRPPDGGRTLRPRCSRRYEAAGRAPAPSRTCHGRCGRRRSRSIGALPGWRCPRRMRSAARPRPRRRGRSSRRPTRAGARPR